MKNLNINLFSRVSHVDRLLFTKHLSIMLVSGITVFEAIQILLSQTRSPTFKKILQDIKNDLENGKPLSHALAKHPEAFNRFYLSLIEVGEASSKLQENLNYLASHLQKEYAFRKKVQGAFFYPVIVIVFAGIVGISLSLFVLPNLIELFSDLDVTLPVSTQLLLAFSSLMRDYGVLLIASLGLYVVLFRLVVSLPGIKPHWHVFLLSLPVFGRMLQNVKLTSFCRNTGVMMRSGLPITKAFDVVYKAEDNMVFKRYIKNMETALNKGKSLAEELDTGKYKFFPLIAVKMIGVGEKTGKIDSTLIYLGDFFEDEVDDATKNLSTVIEPILLLGIGLVVAFIAFAIISPIYQFTGSIRR